MDFTGKTAIASGAASGMGLLLCQEIVRLGGNAVLADLNGEAVKEKANEINEKYPGHAIGVACDVRNYEEVCKVRDTAVSAFGGIDIVVNFAGGFEMRMLNQYGKFADLPIEVFDWSIDVNLKGQIYFAHACMKQMMKQNSGLIVNIGSISGYEGGGNGVGYSTAKSAAANGLTKSLAQAGAEFGIRCVCVSPGPVLTRPGMASMKTPMGRAAEPQEIIDLILFIASDKGQFINGVDILIDGGRNTMFDRS